jgi:hypothetical protein
MGPVGYNPFWMQHCPARPADLKHAHESNCTDGHVPGQCCECGRLAKDFRLDPDPLTVSEDDLPIKSQRSPADEVATWPPAQQRALQFLRSRFPKGDADGTP